MRVDATAICSTKPFWRNFRQNGFGRLRVFLLLASAPLLGGCSGTTVSSGSSPPRSNPTAPPLSTSADDVDGQSPESVAELYIDAIGRGDFAGANRYVADRYQEMMKAMDVGNPNLSFDASDAPVSDVTIASVAVTGSDATAVWTGTLCAYDASIDDVHCIENTDSESDNPVFVVRLHKEDDGEWKVVMGY